MPIVTVMNQKGGVGKTTWSVNVAHALAEKGKSVLLVDGDPDAGSTIVTGAELRTDSGASVDMTDVMLSGLPLKDITVRPEGWAMDLAPSSPRLRERELRWTREEAFNLKDSLELVEYDWVLIDAPPAIGVMLSSALLASRWCVGVTDPDFLGVIALGRSLIGDNQRPSLISSTQKVNKELEIAGVVLNGADKTSLARDAEGQLVELFGNKFWQPPIPRYQALREARSRAVPITAMAGRNARIMAHAFADHAQHLLNLGGK